MLTTLPTEIVQQILDDLPRSSLRNCCLVNQWLRDESLARLWKTVVLTDCRRHHARADMPEKLADQWSYDLMTFDEQNTDESFGLDDHDDTPMIKVLYLLAKSPHLAAKVTQIVHRCHLPPPSAVGELDFMTFADELSNDWRTLYLLRLAIRNLVNVRTLQIISGHFYITTTLLREFLSPRRVKERPIRHLWLEICNIDGSLLPSIRNSPEDFDEHLKRKDPDMVPRYLDLRGLESLRIRRIRLGGYDDSSPCLSRARFGERSNFHNGRGSLYTTLTNAESNRVIGRPLWLCRSNFDKSIPENTPLDWTDDSLYEEGHGFVSTTWLNERIWLQLPEALAFVQKHSLDKVLDDYTTDEAVDEILGTSNRYPDPAYRSRVDMDRPVRGQALFTLLGQSMTSLTSLNLDWLSIRHRTHTGHHHGFIYSLFSELSQLRFPHLKVFQYRNAVTHTTYPLSGICLLQSSNIQVCDEYTVRETTYAIDFPTFLRAHDKIICLAWPIESFYLSDDVAEAQSSSIRAAEQASLVSQLGRRLFSLRVDAPFSNTGEPQTDNDEEPYARRQCLLRRKFITDFATQMTALTGIKLEGGIPKDEQRQILLALRRCPLQKIVQIGMNSPLGNTWGMNARDLAEMDEIDVRYSNLLEPEPVKELERCTRMEPKPQQSTTTYAPVFPGAMTPPLPYIIASNFADTITELKFCGHHGSPIPYRPTPITHHLLHHLRYLPNLRQLAISMWLMTGFDMDWREREIIDYWSTVQRPYTSPHPWSADDRPERDYDEPPHADESLFQNRMFGEGPPPRSVGQQVGGTNQIQTVRGAILSTLDSTLLATHQYPTAEEGHSLWLDGREARLAGWLAANHHPREMARQVTNMISPHLNPLAMAARSPHKSKSEQGVKIRALFCIGIEQSDIFELDVWINGPGSFCGYRGPMDEASWVRWWEKLDERGWFEKV